MWCSVLTIFFSLPRRFTSEKLFKSIQMVSSHPVKTIVELFGHNYFDLFTSKNSFEVECVVDLTMMVQGIRGRFYLLILSVFPVFSL